MKKFKKVLLAVATFAIAFIAVGLASSNTKAEAARWHNGTPKVLRGKLETKYGSKLNRRWTIVRIGKKTVTISASGMPVVYGSRAKYKNLGKHRYTLRYYVKHTMQIPGRRYENITVRKVGKKYKINAIDSHWFKKY